MIPSPTQLLAEIESGEIPLAELFASADCDALLDQRDDNAKFEDAFCENSDRNEELKSKLNRDPTEPVRRESFLIVSRAAQQHEIASYVSDDFGLIAWHSFGLVDGDIPRTDAPFVEWLYAQYKAGKFPMTPNS